MKLDSAFVRLNVMCILELMMDEEFHPGVLKSKQLIQMNRNLRDAIDSGNVDQLKLLRVKFLEQIEGETIGYIFIYKNCLVSIIDCILNHDHTPDEELSQILERITWSSLVFSMADSIHMSKEQHMEAVNAYYDSLLQRSRDKCKQMIVDKVATLSKVRAS